MVQGIRDIHMHCIPGVDDGAEGYEMALQMLRMSYDQGVRKIYCTSHEFAFEDYGKEVEERFIELKRRAAELFPDLELLLGCELYCSSGRLIKESLKKLDDRSLPSMNRSKYVLVEFPTAEYPFEEMKTCLLGLLEEGWKPIVAHVERYPKTVKTVEQARELRNMGARLQVNAFSVVEEQNEVIREFANRLLDAELIDCIGSDAHRINLRPPRIRSGVEEIYRKCRKEYADKICLGRS